MKITKISAFTLVELIVVIVVIGIISGVGVASILTASDALAFLTVRSDMDQSADVAMSRMSQEIKRLKDKDSISTANASQFTFTDVVDASLSYWLSGSNFMRNFDILASNVSGLAFKYYDENDSELTPPQGGSDTNVRRVEILLTFQNGAYAFNYQSQVRPRNLIHLSDKFR